MSQCIESHPLKIQDQVNVLQCPTVVRFADLNQADNQWISNHFYLNKEIQQHIQVIQQCFQQSHGGGIFVIGAYGTGKSHFLAYLIQQIQFQQLIPSPQQVIYLSLLNYPSEQTLESIVNQVIGLESLNASRTENWQKYQQQHPQGILLVMDELSEFLRSKSSSQAFTEDIRFLQFMGEWGQSEAFWLLAAMQEQIEHTGDLELNLYRKIKDRFPIRLLLTANHFGDLLCHHLLQKKSGYDEAVSLLLTRWLPLYPQHQKEVAQLHQYYPLHPLTIRLMEEVRDSFSQTRGMVEFVMVQMLGDEAREIPSFQQRHWGEILSPDFIVDHFKDLFELQPDFLPLSQKLFPFYREHFATLFPNTERQKLAKRLLKLLVLFYISPCRDTLTVQDACYCLLVSVSQLQPEKNHQIIASIFEQLHQQGRYIEKHGNGYRLNLKQDIGAQFEKQLAHHITDLPTNKRILFEESLEGLTQKDFALLQLPCQQWQSYQVHWHFHPRQLTLCLGNAPWPENTHLKLRIALPWQPFEKSAAKGVFDHPSYFILQPATLHFDDDLKQLVALQRMQQHPLSQALAQRVKSQLTHQRQLFIAQLQNAYLQAKLYHQSGQQIQHTTGQLDRFETFIEQVGVTLFRHCFPGFERFAPSHGPLPQAAYVELMHLAQEQDILQYQSSSYLGLIREAYWLPMGLIQRQGKCYKVTPQLGNHQLVKRLQPLLERDPSPKVIHEDLAQPILGLLEDQINLLLIFLLLQGELEITRLKQSYRSLFETLPNLLQYDQVCLSYGLNSTEAEHLKKLLLASELKTPKQWTSLTQKQSITSLQEFAKSHLDTLRKAREQLQQLVSVPAMARGLQQVIEQWKPLLQDVQPFEAWQQFIYEVGVLEDFIEADIEAMALAEFCSRHFNESKRYLHLLSNLHPFMENRHDLPEQWHLLLSDEWQQSFANWQHWLKNFSQFYQEYQTQYQEAHDQWWSTLDITFLQWQPPEIAELQQLNLSKRLESIRELQQQSQQWLCQQCSDLSYQPCCKCGFDFCHVEKFTTIQQQCLQQIERVEIEIKRFFAQTQIKDRLKAWQQAGMESTPELLSYLNNERMLPHVRDLKALDNWLAGAELVKTLEMASLQQKLQHKNWQVKELLQYLKNYLQPFEEYWIRFDDLKSALPKTSTNKKHQDWIMQHCLQSCQTLPDFFDAHWLSSYQTEWVFESTLKNLHQLNYPKPLQQNIAIDLWEGRLAFDPEFAYQHPLIKLITQRLQQPVQWALNPLMELTTLSYRYHHALSSRLGKNWLTHLQALSQSQVRDQQIDLPTYLNQLISQHPQAQFIIVDAMASFTWTALEPMFSQTLKGWTLGETKILKLSNANTSQPSDTKHCYDLLQQNTPMMSFKKINVLDELIHQQCFEFDFLIEKAAVEIKQKLIKLESQLQPDQPLVIFSDHGFRLNAEGKKYQHGGSSWLENWIPVVTYLPKHLFSDKLL